MNNSIYTTEIKRLLVAHNIFYAGRIFFEVFLNVFIWKETHDVTLIALFNIAYLLTHTIAFHIFARVVKMGKIHFTRMLSLLGYALTYFAIFMLRENVIHFVIPIAVVIGFFNGIYWISYHVLRFDITRSHNRGNYTGFEKSSNILASLIFPPLGGAIILANFFGWGYSNLFLLGALLFFISFLIGNFKFPEHKTSPFNFRNTFSLVWKNKDIKKSMMSYFWGGLGKDGAISTFIIPLLIFDVIRNELHLGGLISIFSIVAIIFSIFFGKYIKYKHYGVSLISGGLAYFLMVIFIIYHPSLWAYVVFGLLVQIADVVIGIPKRVINDNLTHSIEDTNNHRVEYIVIREWFGIGFGRILSCFVLLTVANLEINNMKFFLLIIAMAVLAEVFVIKSIKKWEDTRLAIP